MMYKALLICYVQVIKGDRLDRLDAFYLCQQRILIRTFPYNFTVRYLPGLKNQLADCLLHVGGLQDSIRLPKLNVYQITSQLNARCDSLQKVREATQADDTLAILKNTIDQGWPNSIKEVPSKIQPFWTF